MKRNFNEWFKTFRSSICDYSYYVNFEKVYGNVIEEIGNNLGYKDKLTWDEIQSYYRPRIIDETLKNQQDIQNIQLQIGKMITMQSQNIIQQKDDKK